MRLLFLIPERFPTFRADVTTLFGKYLPPLGVASDLVAGTDQAVRSDADWPGGRAVLCDVSGSASYRHLRQMVHFLRVLWKSDRREYDAIQVRDMPIVGAVALVISRLKRLPFFYWMSYPMSEGFIRVARERGLRQGLLKFLFPWLRGHVGGILLYRFVLPRAEHVFVQSAQMKRALEARSIAGEKMTSVPMGVDLEMIGSDGDEAVNDSRLNNATVLAYLGTLDRPRHIEVLFDMLQLVRRSVPDALLLLIGDTYDAEHRAWLQKQATRCGVAAHVVWTGWVPMHRGWQYVRAAHVGLSPIPRGSLFDSASPTKVPEYLALGVPVVCNDNPDQAEVVRLSGAGLCVPYTATDFAKAVVEVVSHRDSPSAKAMRASGRAFVAKHRAYSHIAASVAATYQHRLCGRDFETNEREKSAASGRGPKR